MTARERIARSTLDVAVKGRGKDGAPWAKAHVREMDEGMDPVATAIVTMLKGWADYADATRRIYGQTGLDDEEALIGNDGVLGDYWAQIGGGLVGLLNGRTGHLDRRTIDKLLREIAAANAWNEEL